MCAVGHVCVCVCFFSLLPNARYEIDMEHFCRCWRFPGRARCVTMRCVYCVGHFTLLCACFFYLLSDCSLSFFYLLSANVCYKHIVGRLVFLLDFERIRGLDPQPYIFFFFTFFLVSACEFRALRVGALGEVRMA